MQINDLKENYKVTAIKIFIILTRTEVPTAKPAVRPIVKCSCL